LRTWLIAQVHFIFSAESRRRHRSHAACFPAPLQGFPIVGFHPGFRFASPWATILRRFAAERLSDSRRGLAKSTVLRLGRIFHWLASARRRLKCLDRWVPAKCDRKFGRQRPRPRRKSGLESAGRNNVSVARTCPCSISALLGSQARNRDHAKGLLYLAYRRQHLKRPPCTRIPLGIRSVIMGPFVAMRASVILRPFVAIEFKPRPTNHPKSMSRERGIRCSTY